jgi:hypothetical protein
MPSRLSTTEHEFVMITTWNWWEAQEPCHRHRRYLFQPFGSGADRHSYRSSTRPSCGVHTCLRGSKSRSIAKRNSTSELGGC